MARSRAVLLLTFMCVWFSRISGAEVEMRVRQGDNAVLFSDCVWKNRFDTVWVRNSSHHHQLTITSTVVERGTHPRYSLVWNPLNRTTDLLVKNVTEADLGLYSCALQAHTQTGSWDDVNLSGNTTIRLSLLDETSLTTPCPPVSDCSVCWKLLVSVCPVCVLLSSTCVYFIYRCRAPVEKKGDERGNEKTTTSTSRNSDQVGEDDVCYASLDFPSRGQKHLKKKKKKNTPQTSDFSTYSEVNLRKCRSSEEDSGHLED